MNRPEPAEPQALHPEPMAVLLELKARFDEAANIRWARRLEQAGIHVAYGVIGLKTHSKVILVVRKDYSQLRRYVHVGTGNYHSGTAKLYTDLGLLSCDEEIGQDLTDLFNYLTGYSPPPAYRKILAAPLYPDRGGGTATERGGEAPREEGAVTAGESFPAPAGRQQLTERLVRQTAAGFRPLLAPLNRLPGAAQSARCGRGWPPEP